jgi:hypothetical protein
MRSTVLGQYIRDTLILAISVPVLAGLFGSVSAWMVSRYDFPGRRSLEVLLVGPLAVPAYISAYAYEGIFGYFGPFYRLIRNILPGLALNRYPDISSMPGLILVMAAALYPYVFLLMKQAFRNNISNALEASRSLGGWCGSAVPSPGPADDPAGAGCRPRHRHDGGAERIRRHRLFRTQHPHHGDIQGMVRLLRSLGGPEARGVSHDFCFPIPGT